MVGCLSAAAQNTTRGLEIIQPHKKVALLIGNANYPKAPLKNPTNDAHALHAKFKELGFDSEEVLDANLKTMRHAIETFIEKLGPGDVALFYYSGHGVEFDGKNYLVPVDFDGRRASDAEDDAYPANKLQNGMEQSGAQLRIIILDACRNNPFPASNRGLGGGGWKPQNAAASGTYIAFGTAPGSTASDNEGGINGLFTTHLLRALDQHGLTLSDVFAEVRAGVESDSAKTQVPWSQDGTVGRFYFRPGESRISGGDPPKEVLHILEFTADKNEMTARDIAHLQVRATDPLAEPITYSWSTSAGRLEPHGDAAELSTAGMRGITSSEKINITVTARNLRGDVDSRMIELTVRNPPDLQAQPVIGRIWSDNQDLLLQITQKAPSLKSTSGSLVIDVEIVNGVPEIRKIEGELPGSPITISVAAQNCTVQKIIEPPGAANNWLRTRLQLRPDMPSQPIRITLGYQSASTGKEKKGKR
jgi:hypothetical protein